MRTLKKSVDQSKLLIAVVRRLYQDGKKPAEVVAILNDQQIFTPHGKEWKLGNFMRWTSKVNLNHETIYKRILSNKRLGTNGGYSPEVDRIILEYYGKEKVIDTYKRLCDAGVYTKSGKPFSEVDAANVTFIATRYLGLDPIVQQTSTDGLFQRLRYVQKKQFKKSGKTLKVQPPRKLKPQWSAQSQASVPSVPKDKDMESKELPKKIPASIPDSKTSSPQITTPSEKEILLEQVTEIVNSNLSAETKLRLTQTLLPKN